MKQLMEIRYKLIRKIQIKIGGNLCLITMFGLLLLNINLKNTLDTLKDKNQPLGSLTNHRPLTKSTNTFHSLDNLKK